MSYVFIQTLGLPQMHRRLGQLRMATIVRALVYHRLNYKRHVRHSCIKGGVYLWANAEYHRHVSCSLCMQPASHIHPASAVP